MPATLVAELVRAGIVEEYGTDDDRAAIRLTPKGEQVGRRWR